MTSTTEKFTVTEVPEYESGDWLWAIVDGSWSTVDRFETEQDALDALPEYEAMA